MQSMKHLFTSACFGALVSLCAGMSQAAADQQKWSSQYVSWKSDGHVSDVWNIDQQVWIPRVAEGSYWPMQFGFIGVNYGGYMGLQEGSATAQDVRFSIWNATSAEGPNCKPFGGEGVGQTCTLPVKIDTGKFYRLRLWRLDSASDGQWWGGWLVETDRSGALVGHFIGKIKAPAAAKAINPNSISNFVEYWGQNVPACYDVPLSIAGFSPPALNYQGKGVYDGHTTFGDSQRAGGNHCSTGKEDNGAFITARPHDFGPTKGVLMFLGGRPGQHALAPKWRGTSPPAMPNG